MLTYAPYCSYVVKKVCILRDLTFGKGLPGNVVQNCTNEHEYFNFAQDLLVFIRDIRG